MFKTRWLVVLFVTYFFISFGSVCPTDGADVMAGQTLHIDIPVKLDKANVVFNIDHLALMGDMPFSLGHLNLVANHFGDWNTKGKIIAVFHSDAAYVLLNDKTYNANRNISTGNPYKEIFAGLMKKGVQIEMCGATATFNHWVNADFLPGVIVNTDAMVRVTQLVQEGYVQIKE
ncbi:MAG: DsrE family protein [Thermodesulfovibrionales bacterium]|jgi:intracellular sulfur oxidation DsrE/DsrF family protein